MPISSYMAGWSGAYFHSPSTMNLYWYTPGGSILTIANSRLPLRCNAWRDCQLSKLPSTSTTDPPWVQFIATGTRVGGSGHAARSGATPKWPAD